MTLHICTYRLFMPSRYQIKHEYPCTDLTLKLDSALVESITYAVSKSYVPTHFLEVFHIHLFAGIQFLIDCSVTRAGRDIQLKYTNILNVFCANFRTPVALMFVYNRYKYIGTKLNSLQTLPGYKTSVCISLRTSTLAELYME